MTINILDYLEKSAIRYPRKTAVTDEFHSATFTELLENSKRIGSALIQKEVKPAEPVGVFMEKSVEAIYSFLGIVSAGGFYTMLNTELPAGRLRQITSVLNLKFIITTIALKQVAETIFPDVFICTVDELLQAERNEESLKAIREQAIDTTPLYINFTSGSTGIPKGIVVAHRSVIDFIDCFTELFEIGERDIIANQAPFDFDVSVKDIYSALKTGAELVIVPKRLFSAPVQLLDYLCDHKVTTMIWAVSAICLISTFHGLDYKTPQTINKILFSGEVMPYKHLCTWQKHLPDAVYVNLYGPTEITCNCTYHILQKDRDYSNGIPIGRHFPNEDVFLLDQNNQKIKAPGLIGKLYVRGTALALGYYCLPEKNATQFIQNPLNSAYPERVYDTGDLGMYDENNELLFCGRNDFQIKYMGHRIELEEIERAMSLIDGVERCCCVFHAEKSKLKGYYVGNIEKAALHSIMKETLPIFMIPTLLRKIDEMPLTKNGKIDRSKLEETIGGDPN